MGYIKHRVSKFMDTNLFHGHHMKACLLLDKVEINEYTLTIELRKG